MCGIRNLDAIEIAFCKIKKNKNMSSKVDFYLGKYARFSAFSVLLQLKTYLGIARRGEILKVQCNRRIPSRALLLLKHVTPNTGNVGWTVLDPIVTYF